MKQLEERFYTRSEIGEIVGRDIENTHFARDVKNTLTNWGYSFEYSRKGVKITRIPTKPDELLSEIMIRQFDLDVRIDIYGFAVFLSLLIQDVDGFAAMPWGQRAEVLNEAWEVAVDEKTLRKWCNKLMNTTSLVKDKTKKTYWTTFYVNGVKYQEELEDGKESEEWQRYWAMFFQMRKDGVKEPGKLTFQKLGYCVYSCPAYVFGAWNNVDEVIDLVYQIADMEPFETTVEVHTTMRGE